MVPSHALVAQQTYSASPETGITNFVTTPEPVTSSTVEGSPFYHADFEPGEIRVDGKVVSNVAMRFNAYRNEIQVLGADKSQQYALLKRRNISARIGNEVFRIFPYEAGKGTVKTGYFIVRTSGSIKFLEKLQVTKRQSRKPATPYDSYRPSKYIWTRDFYIFIQNQDAAKEIAKEIRLSRRSLLKIFAKKRETLENFTDRKDLDLKEAADVAILIDHVNQLQSEN